MVYQSNLVNDKILYKFTWDSKKKKKKKTNEERSQIEKPGGYDAWCFSSDHNSLKPNEISLHNAPGLTLHASLKRRGKH